MGSSAANQGCLRALWFCTHQGYSLLVLAHGARQGNTNHELFAQFEADNSISPEGIGLFVSMLSSTRVVMRLRELRSKLNLGSNVAKPDSSREIINSCIRRSVQI